MRRRRRMVFFFVNDTATTEIYTLSLHDALPIFRALHRARVHPLRHGRRGGGLVPVLAQARRRRAHHGLRPHARPRSEEHTSELQSRQYLVCRLLLEKKKQSPTLLSTCPHSCLLP